MTKAEALALFRSDAMPAIRREYESDGVPDYPARREAWNNFVDMLQKDGAITRKQADTWEGLPEGKPAWERKNSLLRLRRSH